MRKNMRNLKRNKDCDRRSENSGLGLIEIILILLLLTMLAVVFKESAVQFFDALIRG